jgi:hypothetical protein
MPSKVSKFVKTIGVINQVFKPSLIQHTRLKIYRTLARLVLIYGSGPGQLERQMKKDCKQQRRNS